MNRRELLASVAAVAVVSTVASLAEMVVDNGPQLVGDGIADDTAAIQAMLDRGERVALPAGKFRVTSTLVLQEGACLDGGGHSQLIIDHNGYYVLCKGRNVVTNNYFRAASSPADLGAFGYMTPFGVVRT
jgi:hypothetical protein